LNEIAKTELILNIDVKASYRKITFNNIKVCKKKNYPDRNEIIAWHNLKNKYEIVFLLSAKSINKAWFVFSVFSQRGRVKI
jgi:hypothetical protein